MPDATAPVIDWRLATATATRLAGRGPAVSRDEARAVVADLRQCASDAVGFVAQQTGLVAPALPGATAVVDRPGWISANVAGFATVLDPVMQRLRERRPPTGPLAGMVPGMAGVEIGSALGFLAGKVLGQYELFVPEERRPRLMLVAPNIMHVERQLEVAPHDFRLWVCLHEETHRVQFTAVPWLGPWLRSEIQDYLSTVDLDGHVMAERLRRAGTSVVGALRGLDAMGMLEQLLTPDELEVLYRLTAVMSLLEGHADVMMDAVGPDVIPTVATIRQRFQQRREDPSLVEGFARRLLGMDAKLQQYRDGAAFTRTVIDAVGVVGFNRVWRSPDTLPTRHELHDPMSWVHRVAADALPAPSG